MINAGNVTVGHVSGSHQLRRVHDEVVTFTVIGQCLLESSAVCSDSEASVESCALSFSNLLVLITVVLQSTGLQVRKRILDATIVVACGLVTAKGATLYTGTTRTPQSVLGSLTGPPFTAARPCQLRL